MRYKNKTDIIPVIIPAYEPDERLLDLLKDLEANNIGPVIIINDGSAKKYDHIFKHAKDMIEKNDGILLEHEINRGKGRALKTAFEYILAKLPHAVGGVTADSDGQHTAKNIINVLEALYENQKNLILGARGFKKEEVPWKSKLGNKLTEAVFFYITDIHVKDTQTGLRGIPREFMKECLHISGERFEFEMRMLLEAIGKYPILEIPIETIYDFKEGHQTHFNPITDSFRIYRILLNTFFKFIISSSSSFLIDFILFIFLYSILEEYYSSFYVAIATVASRIISATYNYIINYKIVFSSKESMVYSSQRYILLAFAQMSLSAIGVTIFARIFMIPVIALKIIVDVLLFFASYYIQKKFIF